MLFFFCKDICGVFLLGFQFLNLFTYLLAMPLVLLKCFEHLESSQRVGVKALNSKVPSWEPVFLAEAGARRVLDHPGILEVFGNSCSGRLPCCASTGHLCTAGSWFSGLSSVYGLFPGAAGL